MKKLRYMASCCVLAMVEMRIPSPRVVRRNKVEMARSKIRLPRMGTPNQKTPMISISARSKKAMAT